MTIADLVQDLEHRIRFAEYPRDWSQVLLRLRTLKSRLPQPKPGARFTGSYRSALAKLVGAARDREATMPMDWRSEVMGQILDIGAIAHVGVVDGNSSPTEPLVIPHD
jgi:hypothetical protein